MSTCTAELNNEHCQRKHHANGYCGMHNIQMRTHGTIRNIHPTPGREHTGLKAPERFALKIKAGGHDGQCWEWKAGLSDDGYGNFHDQGTTHRAHRWLWMHLVDSTLNPETELDHICMNIICVRPSHLQPVQRSQHTEVSRMQRALLKSNEDLILIGGNRKARSIQEISYAVTHNLPSTMYGARLVTSG